MLWVVEVVSDEGIPEYMVSVTVVYLYSIVAVLFYLIVAYHIVVSVDVYPISCVVLDGVAIDGAVVPDQFNAVTRHFHDPI